MEKQERNQRKPSEENRTMTEKKFMEGMLLVPTSLLTRTLDMIKELAAFMNQICEINLALQEGDKSDSDEEINKEK